jgi:hypothetical protein
MTKLLLFFLFVAWPAFAWQLNPQPPPEDALGLADAVFVGKATKITGLPEDKSKDPSLFPDGAPDACPHQEQVEFQSTKTYKPHGDSRSVFVVKACAGLFKKSVEYLVFGCTKDAALWADGALPGNFATLTGPSSLNAPAIKTLENPKQAIQEVIKGLKLLGKIPSVGEYHWVANLDHDFGLDKILRLEQSGGLSQFFYIHQHPWEPKRSTPLAAETKQLRFCGRLTTDLFQKIEIFFDNKPSANSTRFQCRCSIEYRFSAGGFASTNRCH